jgi:TolB protein
MHSATDHVRVGRRRRFRAARSFSSGAVVLAVGVVSVLPAPGPASAAPQYRTERVNVSTRGAQADSGSLTSAISADARYVAFSSTASNLVAGDTNGYEDVFLRDRRSRTTKRISTSYAGRSANGESSSVSMSHDGRYVAFSSNASDLVRGDTNGFTDVFVHDTRTGTTKRVSVSSTGIQSDGENYGSSISADGRYVVFDSYGTTLVPGSGQGSVLIHDRRTRRTELVSGSYQGSGTVTEGSYWSSISANGRYVTFISYASTIVPGDTNDVRDVFVRDLRKRTTVRVSVAHDGAQSVRDSLNPTVTDDGRYVAFTSEDPTLVEGDSGDSADVFLRDLRAGTTRRVGQSPAGEPADDNSSDPWLTPDGRYLVFSSAGTNLTPEETAPGFDVFVEDLRTRRSTLVSRASNGSPGESDSFSAHLTPDARHVVYHSLATNLVPGDTNDDIDVFVTRRLG